MRNCCTAHNPACLCLLITARVSLACIHLVNDDQAWIRCMDMQVMHECACILAAASCSYQLVRLLAVLSLVVFCAPIRSHVAWWLS